jgi:hypothetical protein
VTGRRLRLAALALVGLMQLAVPVGMILGWERTLAEGSRWCFEIRPVDPADPFRGRYLALAFPDAWVPVAAEAEVGRNQWVYVPLETDPEGCAALGPVLHRPPVGPDYLRAQVRNLRHGHPPDGSPDERTALLLLPFDRLYLEEQLARRAEVRLIEVLATAPDQRVRAWVRVRHGQAVLEDVEVGGRSVWELARERP